jgi:hypothetical protein
MKKFLFITLISIITSLYGFSAVDVTVANVTGAGGQTASVGVTASGMDGTNGGTSIVGLQININFTSSVVTYMDIINRNSNLNASGTWTYSGINGQIVVLWEATDLGVPANFSNGDKLFDIQFINNQGGTSNLTLATVEAIDINGSTIDNGTLTNGSITYAAPATTSTWNGSGSWFTPANWSNGIPSSPTSAIIASGTVTVDANAYCNNLTVNNGKGVTINTGKALNVAGNLTLESSSASLPTGSILNNGALNVTGTRTAQRYLTSGVNHFVSTPIQTAYINNFYNASNPGYFYAYIQSTNTWENPWNLDEQLTVSKGYAVNYTNPQTVSLSGVLNNDAQYQLQSSDGFTYTAGNGWNLVGNPYPCPIDWTIAAGWTKTNVANGIYFWNGTTYASYVAGVGTNGGTQFIPPFQGYFVKASAASPILTVKKAARSLSGLTQNYYKNSTENTLRLKINDVDETVVYLNESATNAFDSDFDAYKLMSQLDEVPQIYTESEEVEYSINGKANADYVEFPVVVKVSSEGVYTINVTGTETFPSSSVIMLVNTVNGTSTDLKSMGSVSLNLEAGLYANYVLKIFKNGLGIENGNANNANIYAAGKTIFFQNCENALVTVYDMIGRNVATNKLGSSVNNNFSVNCTEGWYVVKVDGKQNNTTARVYIK